MFSPTGEVKAPVEKKVTAASVGSLLASVVLAILNGVNDYDLLGNLPPVLQTLLLLVLPALVTFVSGYVAPHTPRNWNRGNL